MAQNTRTWGNLISTIEARLGRSLEGNDLTRIQYLINSSALMLFDENLFWERFLVLEPRSVKRGYVDYTEDSYNIFGGGTSEANGLYVRNGEFDGVPAYSIINENGDVIYSLYRSTSNPGPLAIISWNISNGSPAEISPFRMYNNLDVGDTPPLTGWVTQLGESPTPIVQALSEIGEYIGHWNGAKWNCSSPHAGTAYPDQNGIRITDCLEESIVYMAFKKTHSEQYGDGTNGTVDVIPVEWFNYIALQSAAAFEGSEERPTVRVKDIDKAWDQALLKISRQGIYNNIAQRFRSYYGYDVSVR
jgi:hypothetical protein